MSSSNDNNKTKLSPEELIRNFQKLRAEQRFLSQKLSEMEMELHEHKVVIDTLKDLDPSRKCFRMIGGVLCERTVGDVLPALRANVEQLDKVVSTYNRELVAKGAEINAFKEKFDIKIKDESLPVGGTDAPTEPQATGVLVS